MSTHFKYVIYIENRLHLLRKAGTRMIDPLNLKALRPNRWFHIIADLR